MTSYAGRHAELYDLFYREKSYVDEARFVDSCLKKFAAHPVENILELACGTGRHAFEMEKLGYRITATDLSADMLSIARKRSAALGSKVTFLQADMQRLNLADAGYEAVVCLFDSIGFLRTNESIMAALAGIRETLRDEGLFVFEFWHAAAMLSHYEPLRIKRWETPDGEVVRISETRLEPKDQLAMVDYSIYELKKDGTYFSSRETQINRYFLLQEMRAMLTASGFASIKFFSGFEDRETIDAETWHVVGVARKEGCAK